MTEPTPAPKQDGTRDDDRGLMPIWRLSSIGIEMGVATIIGWAIGHFLDKRFGTDPWLMIVLTVLGVAAGFKGMVAAAREATADQTAKAARKRSRGDDATDSEVK